MLVESHRQTKASTGDFGLPTVQDSPYYSVGGWGNVIEKSMAVDRAIVRDIEDGGGNTFQIAFDLLDSGGTVTVNNGIATFNPGSVTNWTGYRGMAETAINSFASVHGYTLTNGVIWPAPSDADINALIAAALPAAPSVYQTVVSQTGTSAPAVGGSLTPLNSYAGAPTFTWARTGTGVYTLTAGSAVFSTAGKTAVILGPLNNLNGQYTAVVTSSTVITITTAVQSLAVLGLLGFTATPTDAMMTKTAVQVLTYA